MTQTIFLFLKNALFIADLLKTNYIKELSDKYRVVVFSNFDDPETGRQLNKLGVERVSWKLQNPGLFKITKFLRTACMHEFDKVSSLQFYYGSPAFQNDKRAKLLRLLSWPFAPIMTVGFFTAVEKFFLRRSKLFEEYCRKYEPALIMTATPGVQVYDAEAILYGKKMGIPTLATNLSWDNLTSFKCVRSRKPDYLFVWNQVLKDAAVNIHHFPADRIFITGSMRFDRYFDGAHPIPAREEFLRTKNLNPAYPTILFASGGRAPYQPQVLEKIIAARKNGMIPYVNFLVRPHPFDDPEFYRPLAGTPDLWVERLTGAIDNPFVNLKATLAHTEINVNHKSTISLESFIFDKPVINFMDPKATFQNKHYFDESSYYYPLIREGSIFLAKNDDELIRGINEYLKNPKQDSAARQRVADNFFAFQDGLSYKRSVELLSKII